MLPCCPCCRFLSNHPTRAISGKRHSSEDFRRARRGWGGGVQKKRLYLSNKGNVQGNNNNCPLRGKMHVVRRELSKAYTALFTRLAFYKEKKHGIVEIPHVSGRGAGEQHGYRAGSQRLICITIRRRKYHARGQELIKSVPTTSRKCTRSKYEGKNRGGGDMKRWQTARNRAKKVICGELRYQQSCRRTLAASAGKGTGLPTTAAADGLQGDMGHASLVSKEVEVITSDQL